MEPAADGLGVERHLRDAFPFGIDVSGEHDTAFPFISPGYVSAYHQTDVLGWEDQFLENAFPLLRAYFSVSMRFPV